MLQTLLNTLPQQGKLEWIGVRPVRRAEVTPLPACVVITGLGLQGDHHAARTSLASKQFSKRQVTLLQAEHLPVIASFMGIKTLDAAVLRRNLLVSGINLLALKDKTFFVGDVLLEGTGVCAPCSRMEEALGAGGYNAMRGHGGITANVIHGGNIHVGDVVRLAG